MGIKEDMAALAAWQSDIAIRHPNGPQPKPLEITRDDLIRLVVGMQWREMGYIFNVVRDQDLIDEDGGVVEPVPPEAAPQLHSHFQSASTIVDEWLGVR